MKEPGSKFEIGVKTMKESTYPISSESSGRNDDYSLESSYDSEIAAIHQN